MFKVHGVKDQRLTYVVKSVKLCLSEFESDFQLLLDSLEIASCWIVIRFRMEITGKEIN